MIEAKNAKDVRGYTNFADEQEVILQPGTQLLVEDNALRRGDLIIVHLIEVDNDEEQSGKNKVSSTKSEHRRTTGEYSVQFYLSNNFLSGIYIRVSIN
jgi:hypothetical protein